MSIQWVGLVLLSECISSAWCWNVSAGFYCEVLCYVEGVLQLSLNKLRVAATGLCQHAECNQLDFLPFKCDGCQKIHCLEHRAYKSHGCPKAYINSRKVIVCEICSTSIETTGKDSDEEVKKMLEKHEKSKDCDPSKKKKPKCPVKRCKQMLTFSNNSTCKICRVQVCLAHRFPADHACKGYGTSVVVSGAGRHIGEKILVPLSARNGKDCGTASNKSSSSSSSNKTSQSPSVRAYWSNRPCNLNFIIKFVNLSELITLFVFLF